MSTNRRVGHAAAATGPARGEGVAGTGLPPRNQEEADMAREPIRPPGVRSTETAGRPAKAPPREPKPPRPKPIAIPSRLKPGGPGGKN